MQHRVPPPPLASYLVTLAAAAAASVAAATSLQGALPEGAATGAATATLVRAALEPALVRAPGGGDAIAISVTVAPQWHIYWRNPGDSGAAPAVKLQLPEGWTSGELAYPRPEVFGDSDERTFGYSGTVHLLVPVKRPEGWQGNLDVQGELSWLACKRSCVSGRSALGGSIATEPAAMSDPPASRAWPKPLPPGASVSLYGDGNSRTLAASIPDLAESAKVRFIPDDCAGIRWGEGTGPFDLQWDGPTRLWTLKTPLAVTPEDAPGRAPRARGLFLVGGEPSGPAIFVDIPVPTAPTLTKP